MSTHDNAISTPVLLPLKSDSTEIQEFRKRLEKIPSLNKVGLGWLKFSCGVEHLQYWLTRLNKFFRCRMTKRGKGWNGYLESYWGAMSIYIGYTPHLTPDLREELGIRKSPNEGHMTVDIPQTALDTLSEQKILEFWIDVYGCEGVKFKRVDIYYDDYCKIISPQKLYKLCRRGGVGVPRFEKARVWDEYDIQKGRDESTTIYFGSLKSDKQICVYDKAMESNGKQDCYRIEGRFKNGQAEAFQNQFGDALSNALGAYTVAESIVVIGNFYKSVIRGAIEFRDIPVGKSPRELDPNWAKRSPLSWFWRELLAGMEPAKLTVSRIQPSLESCVNWFNSQVVSSLALIRSAYQHWGMPFWNWIEECIENGEKRWQDRHWKLLEEALITSPSYSSSVLKEIEWQPGI